MKFIKVNNLQDSFNQVDYKGLKLEDFVPGSQVYKPDLGSCLIATKEENIPSHVDLVELTEAEYIAARTSIEKEIASLPKPKTLEDANAEIKTLQDAVDQLILDSLSI